MQFSKEIPFQGALINVDVVSDRYIFDWEDIVTAQTDQQFFVTRAAKNYAQANFEGDFTLVPEGRIFEVLGILVHAEQDDTEEAYADVRDLFVNGYFEFRIQQTITDRDWLFRLIGGVGLFDTAGVVSPFQGDGAHANVRKYAISRFVPGGRSIEWQAFWPGGIVIANEVDMYVTVYGFEEIPTSVR